MAKDKMTILLLRRVVVDGLILTGLVICVLGSNMLAPFERGFFCGDESLKYPYHNSTVTAFVLKIVGLSLPIMAILVCEWALLRKEDNDVRCLGVRIPAWIRSTYCALMSFGMGTCFVELITNITKVTVGRLRPHFFEVCQPSINCSLPEWRERYIQPNEYNCTGELVDKFVDVRKSFLSGHSSWSAFTMIYLTLYLEGRMQWRGSRVLRHTLQFIAIMLSWFTALSRLSDYKHHWSDVLTGYIVGSLFAILVWTYGTVLIKKKSPKIPVQNEISLTFHRQMALPA